ncbi:MAG: hypothetical protein WDN23_05330 [Edaphobacter sp.]
MGIMLTAHSVVRDPGGNLFDITPLGDETVRPSLRFVAHVGTEDEFWQFERSNRCICCPTEWNMGLPEDINLESNIGWRTADTEDAF